MDEIFDWYRVDCQRCGQSITYALMVPSRAADAEAMAEEIHARNNYRRCDGADPTVRLLERDWRLEPRP